MKTSKAFHVVLFALFLFFTKAAHAGAPLPPGDTNYPPSPIDSWSFQDTNNWTDDYGDLPISFTNITSSQLGNGFSVVVDTNGPAWLNYEIYQTDVDATNLVVNGPGSITFWYAPNWSSGTNGGTGPGQLAQLIDVGELTWDSSVGYFGLSVDAPGSNLWFLAQDGLGDTYGLSSPISWATNDFHFIAFTYSSTNASLYLDGQLATNDPGGLSIWPSLAVQTNGVFFGSDTNGNEQAQGLFNTVQTYNVVLRSNDVQAIYDEQKDIYLLNPLDAAFLVSAPSSPANNSYSFTNSIIPDVITGLGNLQWVGSAGDCIDGANSNIVWITNIVATSAGNGAMNLEFTIEGGSSGVPYDVFANSVLSFGTNGTPWAWEGQGYQCNTYLLTNMPNTACFLILGTPQDSDHDGLTDAYELLVSKSDPNNSSTDGTGMADGWEVLYFGHIGVSPIGDPDGDGLTTFQEWLMRSQGYNPVNWNSFTNSPVGDGYQNYSGDGLANLMQGAFGGNMLTNNTAWKVNTAGDGLPDEYKVMVGLPTNSAQPAPGLPAYSMNPIP